MSDVLAVVVPGILGSTLFYQLKPEPLELWGENLYTNYKRLCKQPHYLDWSGSPAQSRLLKVIRISEYVPLVKRTVYEKLVRNLGYLPDVSNVLECSYDWRDSVLNSCVVVAQSISAEIGEDAATVPKANQPRRVSTTLRHSEVEFSEYSRLNFGVC